MLRIGQLGRKREKRNGINDDMSTTINKTRMEIKEGYGCKKNRIVFNAVGGVQ